MKKQAENMVKETFQQGDLLLRKLAALPAGQRKVVARGRCVLAHGESGHSHVIEDEDAELIRIGEQMLLSVPNAVPVKHEEHGVRTLSPGIWEIGSVREYDWFSQMERRVVD